MDGAARPPSDKFLSDRLLVILHRTDHALYLLSNELFGQIGLTVQQAVVLAFIYHNKGCNQKAVEDHINTRSASVTVLLNTMQGKGLIQKSRNPLDGRGIILSLTAKGRRVAGKIHAVFKEISMRITRALTKQEIETLKALLRKVEKNCGDLSPFLPDAIHDKSHIDPAEVG